MIKHDDMTIADAITPFTTGMLVTEPLPVATVHVQRARLAREATASKAKAMADPSGDARRCLSYVYASTPLARLRPGALASQCGISTERAMEVVAALVKAGLLAPGSTPDRAGVIGPILVEHVMKGEAGE